MLVEAGLGARGEADRIDGAAEDAAGERSRPRNVVVVLVVVRGEVEEMRGAGAVIVVEARGDDERTEADGVRDSELDRGVEAEIDERGEAVTELRGDGGTADREGRGEADLVGVELTVEGVRDGVEGRAAEVEVVDGRRSATGAAELADDDGRRSNTGSLGVADGVGEEFDWLLDADEATEIVGRRDNSMVLASDSAARP